MAPPIGFRHSEESKRKIGLASKVQVRKPISEETRAKLRAAKLGKPAWNKGVPMWWTPARSKGKSPWNKGLKGVQASSRRGKHSHIAGEIHWAWKGGITPINRKIRESLEMKNAKKTALVRDNYTCVLCGVRGGKLEVDHIKQFAFYPELRFELSNLRTLCRSCHLKTETHSKRHA